MKISFKNRKEVLIIKMKTKEWKTSFRRSLSEGSERTEWEGPINRYKCLANPTFHIVYGGLLVVYYATKKGWINKCRGPCMDQCWKCYMPRPMNDHILYTIACDRKCYVFILGCYFSRDQFFLLFWALLRNMLIPFSICLGLRSSCWHSIYGGDL